MNEEMTLPDPLEDPCDICDDRECCDAYEALFCCVRCRYLGLNGDDCDPCLGDLKYDIL